MNKWRSVRMDRYTRIYSDSRKHKPDYAYSYLYGAAILVTLKGINESTTTYQSSNEGIPLSQVT